MTKAPDCPRPLVPLVKSSHRLVAGVRHLRRRSTRARAAHRGALPWPVGAGSPSLACSQCHAAGGLSCLSSLPVSGATEWSSARPVPWSSTVVLEGGALPHRLAATAKTERKLMT
ncbi:unnamed protein product [Urochloa humidicola]